MTNKQKKNLKDTLWTTADQLRAKSGLRSTKYALCIGDDWFSGHRNIA